MSATTNIRIDWSRTNSYTIVADPDDARDGLLHAFVDHTDRERIAQITNAGPAELTSIINGIYNGPDGDGFDESMFSDWLDGREPAPVTANSRSTMPRPPTTGPQGCKNLTAPLPLLGCVVVASGGVTNSEAGTTCGEQANENRQAGLYPAVSAQTRVGTCCGLVRRVSMSRFGCVAR
jgi:hypothetical protein